MSLVTRYTANFNLRIIDYDQSQWHVSAWDNYDIIDATLGLFVRVANIRGPWKNATDYSTGDRVVDTASGFLYETATAHTSASTGTFAEARLASPSLWSRVDQFDTDPTAPSFTITESNDDPPSVNGSIVNSIDSNIFGPTNAGWVGKGLYTRRTNETQDLYDARIADPVNVTEATVYRYLGPEGFRVTQQRTTGFTLTQSYAGQHVIINAASTQNVTFPVGILRDDQKSHVSDIYPHMWGDIYIDPASEDVTLVLGSGVTQKWSNNQTTNVFPKGVTIRWHYVYVANGSAVVYLDVGGAASLIFSDETVTGIAGAGTVEEALTALQTAVEEEVTPADLSITGTPSAGRVPSYSSPSSWAWADIISGTSHSTVTLDTAATITAASHGTGISGGNWVSRLVVARNSSDQSAAVALTLEEDCTLPVVVRAANDQTGSVTISRSGTNTFNGAATSITLAGAGSSVSIIPDRTSGDFAVEGEYVATRTLAGTLNANGNLIQNAELVDTSESVNALGNQSGAVAVDYTDGHYVTVTLTGNATSLAISNPPASGNNGWITFEIDHGAGPYTWSHPSGITWGSGVAPTFSDGANEISIVTYMTRDAGTTWRGFFGGEDFS